MLTAVWLVGGWGSFDAAVIVLPSCTRQTLSCLCHGHVSQKASKPNDVFKNEYRSHFFELYLWIEHLKIRNDNKEQKLKICNRSKIDVLPREIVTRELRGTDPWHFPRGGSTWKSRWNLRTTLKTSQGDIPMTTHDNFDYTPSFVNFF